MPVGEEDGIKYNDLDHFQVSQDDENNDDDEFEPAYQKEPTNFIK